MPEYKRQHYLPTVYLREFSGDKSTFTRSSKVWRCDGKSCVLVPVDSQCFGNYFYSQERANTAETLFQGIEGLYADCVCRIKARQVPRSEHFFGTILMAFDLHLRNAAYENLTGKDNLHAYSVRLHGFKQQLLLGRRHGDINDDEVALHLKRRWRVRILSSSLENELLTSDNPSVWIASPGTVPHFQMAILPITPTHVAVAYDLKFLQVSGEQLTGEDEAILNRLQCSQADRCVYSASSLDEQQQRFVADNLKRKRRRSKTDETVWEANFRKLPPTFQFSFVSSSAPLL